MQGADKLLQSVDGMPLLRRVALNARTVASSVWVTLPRAAPDRERALAGLDLRVLGVDDAAAGMAASFRAFAAALERPGPTLVLPADMPDITVSDLSLIIDTARAEPDRPIRGASAAGQPGHPVYFPAALVSGFSRLKGDAGAKALLKSHPPRLVGLPGDHALTDLDTPEQWRNWRAANPDRA